MVFKSQGRKKKGTCIVCGRDFEYWSSNRRGRFCSSECYHLYLRGENHPRYKEKVKVVCEQCGKGILVFPCKANTKRFCSNKCRDVWQSQHWNGKNNPHWKGGDVERICQWCEKTFRVPRRVVKKGGGKYCSYKCYGMAQRKQLFKICKNCGKAFWKKRPKYFCSKKCKVEYQRGKNNPFYGRKHTEETLKRILKAVHGKPNGVESQLIALIDEYRLPFCYVGNGEVVIAGKNPDFIHSQGDKKVIELFGDYWHSPLLRPNIRHTATYEATKRHYEKHGYDCLIIWESELKNRTRVLDKIIEFTGGKNLVTVNVPE